MDTTDVRLTSISNITDIPIPVTSQHDTTSLDRQLPLVPEAHRLDFSSLEPRYSERSSLQLLLPPRYQTSTADIRFQERMSDPIFGDTRSLNSSSLSVPFPTSSSNLAILEESRALSSLPITNTAPVNSSYQMLSSDLFNSMNQQSNLGSSFGIPSSPQLHGGFIYPHLYGGSQNLQTSFHIPTGEVRTYEILGSRAGDPVGQRQNDMAIQRTTDIPMRVDRSLMSQSRLPLDGAQLQSREDDRSQHHSEMQTNQSPLNTELAGHSPPRVSRNTNGDNGSVWRPY